MSFEAQRLGWRQLDKREVLAESHVYLPDCERLIVKP
jgi:hypothetical protein